MKDVLETKEVIESKDVKYDIDKAASEGNPKIFFGDSSEVNSVRYSDYGSNKNFQFLKGVRHQ